MPSIGGDAGYRRALAPEQGDGRRNARRLEHHKGELPRSHALAHPRDGEEDGLGHRWINGDGIVRPVDMWEDRSVAQVDQLIGLRHVAVRIDSGRLYTTVPDVTVEVARQIGLGEQ